MSTKPLKIVLLIPDTHRPYHDKRAYALMLRVFSAIIEKYKHIATFEIVILGDYADFFAINSHGKDPRLVSMLVDEVEDVIKALDELDALYPEAKKVYIEGNHEYRLERYLLSKAPELFGITSTYHLLKLDTRPLLQFSVRPHTPYRRVALSRLRRH